MLCIAWQGVDTVARCKVMVHHDLSAPGMHGTIAPSALQHQTLQPTTEPLLGLKVLNVLSPCIC
jgi:hypothetical protein